MAQEHWAAGRVIQTMDLLFPFSEYWWFYGAFTAFVLVLFALDLGVSNRHAPFDGGVRLCGDERHFLRLNLCRQSSPSRRNR